MRINNNADHQNRSKNRVSSKFNISGVSSLDPLATRRVEASRKRIVSLMRAATERRLKAGCVVMTGSFSPERPRSRWIKAARGCGQAVVETLLVLPFIAALIVWLFQYFQAIHGSVIHQTQARYALWKTLDHWRDLRGAEDFGLGLANDSASRASYQNRKTSLTVTAVAGVPAGGAGEAPRQGDQVSGIRREVGTFGGSQKREILLQTTVGICRDGACQ